MQNDALIPRPAHQPAWGLDAERGENSGGQEENLENRSLFHIRSGRSRTEHSTPELLNSMRKHKAGYPVSEGGGKDAFHSVSLSNPGQEEIRDAVESVLTGTKAAMADRIPCFMLSH